MSRIKTWILEDKIPPKKSPFRSFGIYENTNSGRMKYKSADEM